MNKDKFVSEKIKEFDKEFNFLTKSEKAIVYTSRSSIKVFLRTSLTEAYLAGQDSVRECVPEEKPEPLLSDPNEDDLVTARNHGWNACRNQTLSDISKLQTKNKEK